MDTIKIGNYIREKREQKGYTQEQLAEIVGVSNKTISSWENGKASTIKMENLEKLAHAFDVSVYEIYNGKDMPQLDEEAKASFDILVKKLEERSFLSLDMGIYTVAVSVVAIAIALWVALPHDALTSGLIIGLFCFGVAFGIVSKYVLAKKKRCAKTDSEEPTNRNK